MALRTPLPTIVLLVAALGLYATGLGLEQWIKYKWNVEADVGLLRYKITGAVDGQGVDVDAGSKWTFGLDCDSKTTIPEKHDRKECNIFRRIDIAVVTLVALAMVGCVYSLHDACFGPGTAVRPFFLSFLMGMTAFILYLAGYDRVRLPYTIVSPQAEAAVEGPPERLLAAVRTSHGAAALALPDTLSDTPDLTFGPGLFVFLGGALFNLAALVFHLTTCSRRKFEEL